MMNEVIVHAIVSGGTLVKIPPMRGRFTIPSIPVLGLSPPYRDLSPIVFTTLTGMIP